jgi:hypothetical protein
VPVPGANAPSLHLIGTRLFCTTKVALWTKKENIKTCLLNLRKTGWIWSDAATGMVKLDNETHLICGANTRQNSLQIPKKVKTPKLLLGTILFAPVPHNPDFELF